MNLGPTTVQTSYPYVLNQSGAGAITLGNGSNVNWIGANIVMSTGDQTIYGAKTFDSTMSINDGLYVGTSIYTLNLYGTHVESTRAITSILACDNDYYFNTSGNINVGLYTTLTNGTATWHINPLGDAKFDDVFATTFGKSATLNQFGGNAYENKFGISAVYNYIGESGSNNQFGKSAGTNNFGDYATNNFGYSGDNRFGQIGTFNSFGSGGINYYESGECMNPLRLKLPRFSGVSAQSGMSGELRLSGNYLYICTGATGGWGRSLISTF